MAVDALALGEQIQALQREVGRLRLEEAFSLQVAMRYGWDPCAVEELIKLVHDKCGGTCDLVCHLAGVPEEALKREVHLNEHQMKMLKDLLGHFSLSFRLEIKGGRMSFYS